MEAENGLDFAASYTISAKIVVLGDQSNQNNSSKNSYSFKLFGFTGVGKSSFVIGFDRNLNPELPVPTLSPTVGASLVTRNVTIEKKTVRMQVVLLPIFHKQHFVYKNNSVNKDLGHCGSREIPSYGPIILQESQCCYNFV